LAYDMHEYWLMPHGLRGIMATVFWPSSREGLRPEVRRREFPLLMPGKASEAQGEHTFWRGSLWVRSVALQGDSSFTKYDLFVLADSQLQYWGTFRGNDYADSEESHAFSSPFTWMHRSMDVGDFSQQRIMDSLMDPRLRRRSQSAELVLRVEVVAHYDSWQDPTSGLRYEDVLEVHYWGRYPEPQSREVYHLARGLGAVRFETFNSREPSGVHSQFAERFEDYSPPDTPALPWFDPFHNATHVPNGFFEDFIVAPVDGGAVSDHLRDWLASSPDVVIAGADGGEAGTHRWRVALRGSDHGADARADFISSTDWIPVTPGRRYRLSGRLWRAAPADRVYLDFADGIGQGGNFDDAQALATRAAAWERVVAETTVGPSTTAVKVRCVRDGANEGPAYCDEVTLQRLD
jgi:hypothetical protein